MKKTDMIKRTKSRILNVLDTADASMTEKALFKKVRGIKKQAGEDDMEKALDELAREGKIKRSRKFVTLVHADEFTAEVTRLNKTFGFVKKKGSEDEIFVPGKFMLGALPGDVVLCRYIAGRGELREAEITDILEAGDASFSGDLVDVNGKLYIRPDSLCKELLEIERGDSAPAEVGDKVIAVISRRGTRHSEHLCKVVASFGTAQVAENCVKTVLYTNEVETEFPAAVMDEARYIGHQHVTEKDIYSRLDLRDKVIFTIDGADTKDIDDAISVERDGNGYRLGVHIADVSHYVKAGSALDRDAFARGTSIYFADTVIPMLPKELSNGICSLNPDEDRLAFSCLMELDENADVKKFKFTKTVIRSRVKGVYSEINRIIEAADYPDEELRAKYDGLLDTIMLMNELSLKLAEKRTRRGAPQIETSECKLTINDSGRCVDVKKRTSGRSEELIEDFMLLANTCAAKKAREAGIPFVYRVHEKPSPEKAERFVQILDKLNIEHPDFSDIKPVHISEILRRVKEEKPDLYPIINYLALRTMAKAKYSEEAIGHFGLALSDYAHFTSPIRRYPDLSIHRILTALCYDKETPSQIGRKYGKFAFGAAKQSSECELIAMKVERDCDACYMAEYMNLHLGEDFSGVICSAAEFGIYVELDNTVEGLVKIESLDGLFAFDGDFSLTKDGKPVYTVGQRVTVKCVRADVSSGNIDFELVEKV